MLLLVNSKREVELAYETLSKMASAPDPATVKDTEQFTPEVLKNIAAYFNNLARRMKFLMDEGAAVMIDNSPQGSGGTVFVPACRPARDA